VLPAEVVVENSDTKITARVTELSRHGCYLDTNSPLSSHTPVLVKIFGVEYFEAHGRVIYAHPSFGMGVAFRSIQLECQRVLHKWLLEAMTKER
jgi:hypothetical protein